MADGTKLAIAILVIWVSLVFFFFAFHPGGVQNVSNPGEMLKWLMDEFTKLAGGDSSTTSDTLPGATPASATPASTTGPVQLLSDVTPASGGTSGNQPSSSSNWMGYTSA